jgi:hypothetical protein
MKAKIYILCVITFSLLSITGCLDDLMEKWYTIKVINNSNADIFVSASCPRYGILNYPDTILPSSKPSLLSISHHDYNNLRSGIEWEKVIDEIPSDTLSIYFFNTDTIDFYTWDQIKIGNKILDRMDLSLNDLQQMNWTVTFHK